ncbi:MAG: hypothetical protein ACE5PO_00630 [Candidatus Bathyarchaeia archaeon]
MLSKVCAVDLRSGILCPKCEEKLRLGEVSKLDIEVAKTLMEMEPRYTAVQNLYLHKCVEAGDVLAILVNRGDVSKILGYGGKILKEISEKTGWRKIRVIAYNEHLRRFVEDLLAPAHVLTINTIWIPDGSKETKAIIPRSDMKKLPANPTVLKELAKNIQGISLRIEFE